MSTEQVTLGPDEEVAQRVWYLFAISGAVNVVFGLLVLAYPDPSIKLLGVFLGIDLLIIGGLLIMRGLSSRADDAEGSGGLLLGTLGVIAGVIVIRNPGETVAVLAIAFAVFLIVAGALALGHALTRPERRGVSLVRGVILIAAGTVIVSWPDVSLKTLAVLIGISLLLHGAVEIAEALLLRKVRPAGG